MGPRKKWLVGGVVVGGGLVAGALFVSVRGGKGRSGDASEPGGSGAGASAANSVTGTRSGNHTRGRTAAGGAVGSAMGVSPGASGSATGNYATAQGRAQGATGAGGSPGMAGGASSGAAPGALGMGGGGVPANAQLGYRPAQLLRYSEVAPSSSKGGDEKSGVFQRIIGLTDATAEQRDKILDLWHQHEDGRRALIASARPRASGPPIVDAQKSADLDLRFEGMVMGKVLTPEQRDKMAKDAYPGAKK